MEPDWPKGTPDHTKPRVLVLNATFTWWLSPCKILKISNGSSHFCCWSNNSSIWLDERRSKPHKCYFHYLHLKIHTKITWFFPQILMIKESCNLIDWKIQPSHPSKRDTFLDDHLHAKNQIDWSIPCRGIDGQRILQSDWRWQTPCKK